MRENFLTENSSRIIVLVCLLLASVHFWTLSRHAINVPFSDDYNELLRNVVLMRDANSPRELLQRLLEGHGYSKPVVARVIALSFLGVMGEIDFRQLVFCGNLFLAALAAVLCLSVARVRAYLAVTVCCLVFQPQFWEAAYQSTLSLSVFSCLFFSLLSIRSMARSGAPAATIALSCAVLALLAFGNGLLVFPVLLFMAVRQRNAARILAVALVLVLFGLLYLSGPTVSYDAGTRFGMVERIRLGVPWLLEFLGGAVGYLFGSGYKPTQAERTVAIVAGALLLLFYAQLIRERYYESNLVLFGFATFFILTGCLAAWLRFATEAPGASRYLIQSVLCLLVMIAIAVDRYGGRLGRPGVALLAVVLPLAFAVQSYRTNLEKISAHKYRLAGGMWTWQSRGEGLVVWTDESAASAILSDCIRRGYYRLPDPRALLNEVWKR